MTGSAHAIETRGISKRYRIGVAGPRYRTLRESLVQAASAPLRAIRRARDGNGDAPDWFWALRDVTVDIPRGSAVGLIGRNGAGKSTLLKVLTRITEPTEGMAVIHGRVGSLLEVGTGFHPELSGRENVYLSGAILGMRRTEIDRKFDEIVSFAEVERFTELPVKRYSSGMYLRLAFAVAAHLEPEILLVDEVLAVGDAVFQRKCLGKMGQVAGEGRTVVFVSHNMGAIQGLCERAIWVDQGRVRAHGSVNEVVTAYLGALTRGDLGADEHSPVAITAVTLRDGAGRPTTVFNPGDDIHVDIRYRARERFTRPSFIVQVNGQLGGLFAANMKLDGRRPASVEGEGSIGCVFHDVPLLPQSYTILVGVRDESGKGVLFDSREVAHFHIAGRLAEHGLEADRADIIAQGSLPVVLPYDWRLPDGSIHPVRLGRAAAGTAP